MKKLCPVCGKTTCNHRQRSGWTRSKTQEQQRVKDAPWRKGYTSKEYREARQRVIRKQQGVCAGCGRVCAQLTSRGWLVTVKGSGVHHTTKLSRGGKVVQGDMVFLCPTCHKKVEQQAH